MAPTTPKIYTDPYYFSGKELKDLSSEEFDNLCDSCLPNNTAGNLAVSFPPTHLGHVLFADNFLHDLQFRASRSTRTGRPTNETDYLDGLPIRQWRLQESSYGSHPNSLENNDPNSSNGQGHLQSGTQQHQGPTHWPNWRLPKGCEQYAPWSLELLKKARAGKTLFRPNADVSTERKSEDTQAVDANNTKSEETSAIPHGFKVKRWQPVPRHMEEPDREYLAKRRKGLSNTHLLGPDGAVVAAATGVAANGGVGGATAEEAAAAGGGTGASEEPRRRPPPPRRKPKPKGPGRGRKKMTSSEGMGVSASADALATESKDVQMEDVGEGTPNDSRRDSEKHANEETHINGEDDEEEGEIEEGDDDDGEDVAEGDQDAENEGSEEGEIAPTPPAVNPMNVGGAFEENVTTSAKGPDASELLEKFQSETKVVNTQDEAAPVETLPPSVEALTTSEEKQSSLELTKEELSPPPAPVDSNTMLPPADPPVPAGPKVENISPSPAVPNEVVNSEPATAPERDKDEHKFESAADPSAPATEADHRDEEEDGQEEGEVPEE